MLGLMYREDNRLISNTSWSPFLPCVFSPLRVEYWKKHNYISLNLTLEEEDEEEEEEEELDTSDRELRYLSGDVTRPQKTGDADAVIIHCVGMSCVYTHAMPYVHVNVLFPINIHARCSQMCVIFLALIINYLVGNMSLIYASGLRD